MNNTPDRLKKGIVFNIQKFSVHDGPGIRTIIFLKGCSLRCDWCSNPESQRLNRELAYNPNKCLTDQACGRCRDVCPRQALSVGDDGKMIWDASACDQCLLCAEACPNHALNVYGYEISVEDALRKVEEDEAFYSRSGGGVTLSGGEPLFQEEFALALLREARKRRIDTCIETCGNVPWEVLEEACKYLNSIYYDIKSVDKKAHIKHTGTSNELILGNLVRLKQTFPELPVRVRTPVIPGFNDSAEAIAGIVDFIKDMPNIDYELLAYHRMGSPKYGYLGRDYSLEGLGSLPRNRFDELRDFAASRLKQTGEEHFSGKGCLKPRDSVYADQDGKGLFGKMKPSIWEWVTNEGLLNHLVAGFPTWGLLLTMTACIYVLTKGADYMIDGAASLAMHTGMPRIVIGATIISLGTTTPEMFVSVLAAWTGNPGLALGNGVGSIICDTGLIFGSMCILSRIPVSQYILNRTGWVQVGAATLLVVISILSYAVSGGHPVLGRWVGLFFLALLAGYLYMAYRWARRGIAYEDEKEEPHWGTLRSLFFTLIGLLGVVLSSRVLVPVAAEGAGRMGVPQDIIAATLVAFGTSLPELTTAITSVRKGYPQIMVGNVVGADVLNCLFVIGAAAAARPLEIPSNFFEFHFPAMLIILYSFRVFIFINQDGWFKRWQGIWILGVYLVYLILQYAFNVGA